LLVESTVALLYYYGLGTSTNKKQVVYWMRKVYDNGYKDAWDNLELWKY